MTEPEAPGERRIELAIISDTHGLLRPSLFRALEGVDHILHAGDVGSSDILTALEAVAPVTAVTGNTDGFELRHRIPEVQTLEIGGIRVVVTHGHQFGRGPTPALLREAWPDAGLVVFGHTHRPLMEEIGDAWFVNPGSCGPRRFDLPVEMVRATIANGRFQAEAIPLDTADH
ncbi:metallophosphoesterase family protein [soil metagenome]